MVDTGDGVHVKPQPVMSLRDQVMATFRSQIGVQQTGDNTGPEVDMYLAAAGLGPGHPWCAAFIAWGLQQHDIQAPQSAAWSPAWFPVSRTIDNEQAQAGDIGGIYFRTLKRIAHVFVYDHNPVRGSNFVVTIEGNTNDDGSRNGHSVMRKKRSKNVIHKTSNWIDI